MGEKGAGNGKEIEFFSEMVLQGGKQMAGSEEEQQGRDRQSEAQRLQGSTQFQQKQNKRFSQFDHSVCIRDKENFLSVAGKN